MYTLSIILILIACVLIILAVLAQNPKSGMAANFGASNQVMGVRQTADFLEKFTWGLAVAIFVLSLVATMTMPKDDIAASKSAIEKAIEGSATPAGPMPNQLTAPATAAPADETAAPATETAQQEAPAESAE